MKASGDVSPLIVGRTMNQGIDIHRSPGARLRFDRSPNTSVRGCPLAESADLRVWEPHQGSALSTGSAGQHLVAS